MNTWWESLSARERVLLGVASVVVLSGFFYFFLWRPVLNQVHSLQEAVAEERTEMTWMTQAAAEVRALRGVVVTEKHSGESLLSLIDRSARAAGMGSNLNRVEPEGNDKVRLWLNDVAFDVLIPWLAELHKSQGVTPESMVAERQSIPGQVNARLVLVAVGGVNGQPPPPSGGGL